MTKDIELSNAWLEVYLLKQQGKRVNLAGGKPLDEVLEERMFQEAEERIDLSISRRQENDKAGQAIPEWERDFKETEIILFDRR